MRQRLELKRISMYFYINVCEWLKKRHIWPTFLFLLRKRKKKILPYIRASHLVCIGETMQLTPVCQWRFLESGECKKGCLFFLLSLCLCVGKCLDGREKTRMKVRKEKANLESEQTEKKNPSTAISR